MFEDYKKRIPKVIFENPDELISGGEHQKLLLDGVDLVESELNKKADSKDVETELGKKVDSTSFDEYKKGQELVNDSKVDKESYDKDLDAVNERINASDAGVSENKQELNGIKKLLGEAVDSSKVVGTAKGGGVITFPSNVLTNASPRYRVEGLSLKQPLTDLALDWGVWGGALPNILVTKDEDDESITLMNTADTEAQLAVFHKGYPLSLRVEDKLYVVFKGDTNWVLFNYCFIKAKNAPNTGIGDVFSENDRGFLSGLFSPKVDGDECSIMLGVYARSDELSENNGIYIKIEGRPMAINLTQLFGKGNEPSKEWCDEHITGYFDGVKSVQALMRIKSTDKDGRNENLLYLNNNLELKSVGAVKDYIENDILYKNISDDGEVLDQPEAINLNISGLITNYPNGTVFIEPVANLTAFYSNGLDVSSLTIEEVESFSTFKDGNYQELNVSKVSIKDGKLTHPDAVNGLCYLVYRHDNAPIYGNNEVDYYNSEKTLKSPNGKVWKKVEEATDEGELVTKLEEVK